MSLHLSFKKNVQFFLKVVIWASKAKKWPCQAVLEIFQDMVKSLGKNLSFSSSLVNTGQHRKKLTYLGYHPTFSVPCINLNVFASWGSTTKLNVGNKTYFILIMYVCFTRTSLQMGLAWHFHHSNRRIELQQEKIEQTSKVLHWLINGYDV